MTRSALIATATLPALLLACSGRPGSPATDRSRTVLEGYVQAWNHHDSAAFDTLLARDAVHEDIALNFHGQGAAQIKDFLRAVTKQQPDLDWRLTAVVTAGPLVAAEWTWTGTYTGDSPSGPVVRKRIGGRGASWAVIEDGKIKRFTDYYDAASFFRRAAGDSTGK